ncbi:myosin-2 essential light chain-like isoform X1 [Paramuricea clavata]|uniref:Myosin-2 essential light chain-like isoform X1 n=1 Tax=Paramuricea clavata TaxID=317549 RepID=A0A6S7G317_PARCT|nr:myosin-2 essential light chain-like isoform X1 [Paramuricea clavata]
MRTDSYLTAKQSNSQLYRSCIVDIKMSNQEIHSDDCREVFMLYDRVGDNKIRVDEVGEVLRALGSNPTESELAKLEQQFKVGKDTRISFEAFWPIFQATKARKLTPGKYKHFTFTGDWVNLKPCSNFCTSCLSSPDRTVICKRTNSGQPNVRIAK